MGSLQFPFFAPPRATPSDWAGWGEKWQQHRSSKWQQPPTAWHQIRCRVNPWHTEEQEAGRKGGSAGAVPSCVVPAQVRESHPTLFELESEEQEEVAMWVQLEDVWLWHIFSLSTLDLGTDIENWQSHLTLQVRYSSSADRSWSLGCMLLTPSLKHIVTGKRYFFLLSCLV